MRSVTIPGSVIEVEESSFALCPLLEKVIISSADIIFNKESFAGSTRLIDLAAAAGFPSNSRDRFWAGKDNNGDNVYEECSLGDGVGPYLIDRFHNDEKKKSIVRAMRRFCEIAHQSDGTEAEKVEAARAQFPEQTMGIWTAGDFLKQTREGMLGVLGYVGLEV